MNLRIREYGIIIGSGTPGALNKISDVDGVTVGHASIVSQRHKTGVTVIMPSEDNMFARKLTAAAYIHNGYGKTQGLVQIEELGTLETPIALTNTLSVGLVYDSMVDYMMERCKEDGVRMASVNPIVGECNDSILNDIQHRVISDIDVKTAIRNARRDFEEGDIGAGKGTVCFGMKGGIGSASRVITADNHNFTIGVLVQSNFGSTESFLLNQKTIGAMIKEQIEPVQLDRGSIMIIVATDLPVSDRQLKRIIKRAGVGLSRTGSFMGHGSGDIIIGFSTANRYLDRPKEEIQTIHILAESKLECAFNAVAEATEEAIINSLAMAKTVKGFGGIVKHSLSDLYLSKLGFRL